MRPSKDYYVYIMASKRNGTLYVGVTNDLIRRVYEHKHDLIDGFTKRYGVHMLVYFEECPDVVSTIEREKHLKSWHRQWKIRLIQETNPEWKDLYGEILEAPDESGRSLETFSYRCVCESATAPAWRLLTGVVSSIHHQTKGGSVSLPGTVLKMSFPRPALRDLR